MLTKKRTQMLKRYAATFCDTVRKDYKTRNITAKNPKVHLYAAQGVCSTMLIDFAINENGKMLIDGETIDDGITIYNILRETPGELRRTVRHECLHFLLRESGLPWKDTDSLFLLMACKYDARPYMILNRPDLIELLERG